MSELAEHLEHYDIETLNSLEHERGQIPWTAVTEFIENLPDADWRLVAELLTGSEDSVPNHTRPDVRCFYYYLYCLHRHRRGELGPYFRDIYRQRFERQRASEDTDLNVSTPQQILARLNSYRNETEASKRADALHNLMIDLADVRRLSNELSIPLTGDLLNIDNYLNNPTLLLPPPPPPTTPPPVGITTPTRPDVNIANFYNALMVFARALRGQKKGVTDKILARPLPGYVPILLGIRAEHASLGKAGKALDRDSAKDFSRFLIGSSWSYDKDGSNTDITTRHSFRAIIGQFEFLKELSEEKHIHKKDLEHILKDVPPEKIALLLGFLYWQMSTARRQWNQGIATVYLKEAREFVRHIEEILADRMTKALTEGESAKMWERTREIEHPWLYTQLARVVAGGSQGQPEKIIEELKEIPKIKFPEGHHSEKQKWQAIADAASVVSGVGHVLEVAGVLPKGKKEEKKPEKPKGGGNEPPH